MSDLDKQISLTVDPNTYIELDAARARIQAEIDAYPLTMAVQVYGENISEQLQALELSPIKVDVAVDANSLKELPNAIGNVPADNLEETFDTTKGIATAAKLAGQAFSNMGSSFESPALNIMGVLAQAIANMILAYSQASEMSTSMGPFGWLAFSLTGLATLTGIIGQMKSIGQFADGGIAYGPTLGLFGEYAGAANNPEVVAPLDKLRSMIEPQGNGMVGEVSFRIKGRDLVGVLVKETTLKSRS